MSLFLEIRNTTYDSPTLYLCGKSSSICSAVSIEHWLMTDTRASTGP